MGVKSVLWILILFTWDGGSVEVSGRSASADECKARFEASQSDNQPRYLAYLCVPVEGTATN